MSNQQRVKDDEKPEVPSLPYDELRAALGNDRKGREALDRLKAALDLKRPTREQVEHHVHTLRSMPAIAATIANWYEAPQTQRWLTVLMDMGL